MLTLIETPAASLLSRLGDDRPLEALHLEIAAEIERGLGPVHAGLFASPVTGSSGIVWTAPGRAFRRYTDLSAEDRRALTAVIGSLLSDIRRLAESGAAPAVAAAWPAMREIPGYTNIFAVDGRPVLTGWGHAGTDGRGGVLSRTDDGIPLYTPPARPWRLYVAILGALALFALAAGLVLPLAGPWFIANPMVCTMQPGQIDLLAEQNREQGRADDLRGLLASLRDQEGRKRLECPLPAPPVHADLPADKWDKRDLSILDGCWNKYTHLVLRDTVTSAEISVRDWTICFDRGGHGKQNLTLSDGSRCQNSLTAAFTDNNQLLLTDLAQCRGATRNKLRSSAICHRISDKEAECESRDLEGPFIHDTSVGQFRR